MRILFYILLIFNIIGVIRDMGMTLFGNMRDQIDGCFLMVCNGVAVWCLSDVLNKIKKNKKQENGKQRNNNIRPIDVA